MREKIKLALIPNDMYSEYRSAAIFKAYKWDPQVEDHNTVSNCVILMDNQTAVELETLAEKLSTETILMEEAIIKNLNCIKDLALPKKITKVLPRLKNYDYQQNVRLMRFDFHPTEAGWAVSEVNSDVPGGFAEASILPEIASKYFKGYEPRKQLIKNLCEAFKTKIKSDGMVAFVHATSYSDDRQVMQYASDYFNKQGFKTIMAAPNHIKWIDKRAACLIEGAEGDIDGIMRFFPLEWLINLPKKSNWAGYYDSKTPACNHPISIFAQSKRLPLIWDRLGIDISTWQQVLPKTKNPKLICKKADDEWIYKPALGRVGEGISIKSVVSKKEMLAIEKSVKKYPNKWVAQEMFNSKPLLTDNGELYHLCIGVFTVDGKSAGFYGRISPYPRIDANAKDIPILVLKGENDEK